MPLLPRIDVLDTSMSVSSDDTTAHTPAKSSKLKSFFRWRKTADSIQRPQTHAGLSPSSPNLPIIPSESTLRPRPSVVARSHSENAVHRKTQTVRPVKRRERARHITTTDPPPWIQAHSLALLHASLDSPVNFYDKSVSRRNSIGSKANGASLPESTVEVKRSHKRTASGESTCTLKEKAFFLTTDGHVLQYDGEGGGDRLPEKILELGAESVAFASDAVPGHRWVLQIAKNGMSAKQDAGPVLRSKWSRLTLRNAESKRTVETMLLVFGDPEDLYTWLFAVRKEIEQFGGLEYRPDTDEDDQSWRDELNRTYGGENEGVSSENQLSSPLGSNVFDSTKLSTDTARLAAPSAPRIQSMQSAASSTASVTSLDRLRDSLTSEGYSSTVATSSAAESLPATSPTLDTFPSVKASTERRSDGGSLRLSSMNDPSIFRMSTLSPPPSSIRERRKLSTTALQLNRDNNAPPTSNSATVGKSTPTEQLSPTDTPVSMIAPLPNTQPRRKSMHTARQKPNTESPNSTTDVSDIRPPSSFRAPVGRQPSVSESLSDVRKPKYSLFPTRPQETKPEITLSPVLNAVSATDNTPAIQVSEATSEKPQKASQSTETTTHRKTRSRTLTLNLPSYHVAPGLLSPTNIDFDKPQRSPAVTDAMIMSNFGALPLQTQPSSPLPNINVPGLQDLSMDLDFLKTPPPQTRSRSPSAKRKVSPTKSMPNMVSENPGVARAPVGPPPTGPLPAVPTSSNSRPSSRGKPSAEFDSRRRSGRVSACKEPRSGPIPQVAQRAQSDNPHTQHGNTQRISHKHSRTISDSKDGPPPPPRGSSARTGPKHPSIDARVAPGHAKQHSGNWSSTVRVN